MVQHPAQAQPARAFNGPTMEIWRPTGAPFG